MPAARWVPKTNESSTHLLVVIVFELLLVDGFVVGVALGHVERVALLLVLGVVNSVVYCKSKRNTCSCQNSS